MITDIFYIPRKSEYSLGPDVQWVEVIQFSEDLIFIPGIQGKSQALTSKGHLLTSRPAPWHVCTCIDKHVCTYTEAIIIIIVVIIII